MDIEQVLDKVNDHTKAVFLTHVLGYNGLNQRLLDEPCYQVGLISSDDIKAMGSSLKKTYEAMKNFWDLNQLKLEDSAWSFMALESVF